MVETSASSMKTSVQYSSDTKFPSCPKTGTGSIAEEEVRKSRVHKRGGGGEGGGGEGGG